VEKHTFMAYTSNWTPILLCMHTPIAQDMQEQLIVHSLVQYINILWLKRHLQLWKSATSSGSLSAQELWSQPLSSWWLLSGLQYVHVFSTLWNEVNKHVHWYYVSADLCHRLD